VQRRQSVLNLRGFEEAYVRREIDVAKREMKGNSKKLTRTRFELPPPDGTTFWPPNVSNFLLPYLFFFLPGAVGAWGITMLCPEGHSDVIAWGWRWRAVMCIDKIVVVVYRRYMCRTCAQAHGGSAPHGGGDAMEPDSDADEPQYTFRSIDPRVLARLPLYVQLAFKFYVPHASSKSVGCTQRLLRQLQVPFPPLPPAPLRSPRAARPATLTPSDPALPGPRRARHVQVLRDAGVQGPRQVPHVPVPALRCLGEHAPPPAPASGPRLGLHPPLLAWTWLAQRERERERESEREIQREENAIILFSVSAGFDPARY